MHSSNDQYFRDSDEQDIPEYVQIREWEWKDTIELLVTEEPLSKQPLFLRTCDIVFLKESYLERKKKRKRKYRQQLDTWYYTCKRGNLVKRDLNTQGPLTSLNSCGSCEGPNVSLQHVYERFSRIALSSSKTLKLNSCRRIAVIHRSDSSEGGNKQRSKECISSECFKRLISLANRDDDNINVKSETLILHEKDSLQSFICSRNDNDMIYRVTMTLSLATSSHDDKQTTGERLTEKRDDKSLTQRIDSFVPRLCIHVIENYHSMPNIIFEENVDEKLLPVTIKDEIVSSTKSLSQHVQAILHDRSKEIDAGFMGVTKPQILTLVADFVVDDKNRLTLIHIPRLVTVIYPIEKECSLTLINIARADIASFFRFEDEKYQSAIRDDRQNNHLNGKNRNLASSYGGELPSVSSTVDCGKTSNYKGHYSVPLVADSKGTSKFKEQSQEVIVVLRKRVIQLEADLKVEASKAKQSAVTAFEASESVRTLNRKISQMERQHKLFANQVQSSHENYVLKLKSELSASKSEVAGLKSKITKESDDDSQVKSDLLLKIRDLHFQVEDSERKFGEERRLLTSQNAAAEQAYAAEFRKEMSDKRSIITKLEDEVQLLKDSIHILKKDKIILEQKVSDSMQARRNLEVEMKDIKTIISRQVDEVKRADDCPANSQLEDDGKIRSLSNKVDYLKAQLLSEAALKDDFVIAIEKLTKENERISTSARSRVLELENHKAQEILKVQEEAQKAISISLQEVSQLKSKLNALQQKLHDSEEQLKLAKLAEKEAVDNFSKEKSKISVLYQDLATAKNEIEARRDETKLFKDSFNSSASEAVIRRLDNERKYLKSQLENEVQTKLDAQEKLGELSLQVRKLSEKSRSDVDSLKQIIRNKDLQIKDIEEMAKVKCQALEADNNLQVEQVEELRNAYVKTRDQLRLDQATIEQIRAASKRLAQELKAAQDEVDYSKKIAKETNTRHNENLHAISCSMKNIETKHLSVVGQLKTSLHKALSSVSEGQRDMLEQQQKFDKQKVDNEKMNSAKLFCLSVDYLSRNRLIQSFTKWTEYLSKSKSHAAHLKAMSEAIALTEKRAKSDSDAVLEQVLKQIKLEKDSLIYNTQATMSKEKQILEEKAAENLRKAVDEGKARLLKILAEKRSAWENREHEIKEKHISMMEQQAEANKKHIESMNTQFDKKMSQRCNEMEQGFVEKQEILAKDFKRQTEEAVKRVEVQSKCMLDKEIQKIKIRHENELSKQRLEHQEAVTVVKKEHEIELARNVKEERLQAKQKFDEMKKKLSLEADKRLSDKMKECEALIEKEREVNKVRNDELMKEYIKSQDKIYHAKEEKLESIINANVLKKVDIEKQHLESHNKKQIELREFAWQEKISAIEQRFVIEREKAFNDGFNKRSAECSNEVDALKESMKQTINEIKTSAESSIIEAANASKSNLNRLRVTFEKEKAELLSESATKLESLKSELKEFYGKKESEAVRLNEETIRKKLEKQHTDDFEKKLKVERDVYRRLEADFKAARKLWIKERASLKDEGQRSTLILEERLKEQAKAFEIKQIKSLEEVEGRVFRELQEQQIKIEDRYSITINNLKDEYKVKQRNELEKEKAKLEEKWKKEISNNSEKASQELDKISMELKNCKEQLVVSQKSNRSIQEKFEASIKDKALLEKSIGFVQKQLSFLHLRSLVGYMIERQKEKSRVETEFAKYECKIKVLEQKHMGEIENISRENDSTKKESWNLAKNLNLVRKIIVGHKSEDLQKMRSRCVEISEVLAEVEKEGKAIKKKRDLSEKEIDKMQDNLRRLEDQIQAHSKTSALQNGRINMSHARKKRKLDEEFDILVEEIEEKRCNFVKVEDRLSNIDKRKHDIEASLNKLEQSIVDIVIEKQLILFETLDSSGEDCIK